jgi:uncharacterized protein YajQ (UPF0234 family)
VNDLSPTVQGFIGPGVFTVLALGVWAARQYWWARKTMRSDLRQERKDDASEEYEIAKISDQAYDLQAARELKISDVWKAQFKELEERTDKRIADLEKREQQNYAEYTHRLLGYQAEQSKNIARIAFLEEENVKCNKTATEQAIRIGGLEDRLSLVLQAVKANGYDLKLDWMNPKPALPTVTTIIQTETPGEGHK